MVKKITCIVSAGVLVLCMFPPPLPGSDLTVGFGLGASLGKVSDLNVSLTLRFFKVISLRGIYAIALEWGEDGRGFAGPAAEAAITFYRRKHINIYAYGTAWFLTGSRETLELPNPKGDSYTGFSFGLGSEIFNAAYIQLGYLALGDIHTPVFGAGWRLYL